MTWEKGDFLYEGKAKKVWKTGDPKVYIIEYKDHLTAFNAEKKATLEGKGRLNNEISAYLLAHLAARGVPTHFVERIDERHQAVRAVTIIPLEVVVRNVTTGSLCKRLGVEEGMELPRPLLELYLKDDALGDPLVTDDHALLFGWATEEELATLKAITLEVNDLLRALFRDLSIVLVDFKLEFGRTAEGDLVLADEISPDTCRFWDLATGDRLDKDRFRKDLGDVLGAYREIWRRLSTREA
ncbi:phosphoribosylaminoimidazolesuccinocarboxamide synthase [Aminithiophilus ramosus]|uniref:Phosphoribosylaminoimidazole-succinocarboxamide synthase n=2 Tax=Synergistales TaxID=649776 RepID=A0A9Q7ADV3_9BACT|nr:phosphoribosylaminoimidazolesuccinocarboxamide synthase [Aminithiophilus ramosus]QTX32958.1 phosphoribosylaminoimidazolesuccinocarboxamide synthase [Aminithiophilus ramosus]QVL37277.1 phosphoribosylaminoimidazolesuccinocarboxamide synthase [Synergistota bacterium]